VPRRSLAVASVENAAEDLLIKISRSVDVGDGDEMSDGKPFAGASHTSFVRFVRCSLATPNPMNSAHLGGWPTLAVFKGLGYLAPHAHILHLPNERFSRDPEVVEAMNEDPLIAHETQSTRTMAAMVRADERLKKEFPLITLPVLILHGTADKNTKPSGSQHFYDSVGSVDKTLKLYEGSFHDLLNDLDKRMVMQDIQDWIGARLRAASETPAQANAASLQEA
jgi:pimeloyl-ACP methyl ester carboxylesterase